MRIALIVTRPKLWWTTLAVLANSETADADLFWAPSIEAARRLPACDLLLLSTDALTEGAIEGGSRRFPHRRLIFWDGMHSIREMGASADRLRDLPALYVGGIEGQRFPWDRSSLLFPQEPRRFRDLARVLRRPSTLARLPPGNRIFLRARSTLISVKHARQIPTDVVTDRRALIFAGQSGRITLERFRSSATPHLRAFISMLDLFEAGGPVMPPDLEPLVEECTWLIDDLETWDRYVFVSSLARAYHLVNVRTAGLPCEFRFHPAPNVNYYQSRLRSRAVYLDFGGANGNERIYPRTADLLVLGKQFLSIRPPADPLPAASILESISAQSTHLVEDCREWLESPPIGAA